MPKIEEGWQNGFPIQRGDYDHPPCALDDKGHCGKEIPGENDPLYDERDGLPKSRKHVMHDKEKEEG